jgi:hypothetical protein
MMQLKMKRLQDGAIAKMKRLYNEAVSNKNLILSRSTQPIKLEPYTLLFYIIFVALYFPSKTAH